MPAPLTTLPMPATLTTHPLRTLWITAERRMRASFLATREALAPFLVPHRFEADYDRAPETLRRARFGYGIRLNKSYLTEILGHVRSAEAKYEWGTLAEGEAEADGTPAGGVARGLWTDATLEGERLPDFFAGTVLEWVCSSPGGFVVVDNPPSDPSTPALTRADEKAAKRRPYFKWVPWSAVADYGYGVRGFRWLELIEVADTRQPGAQGGDGLEERRVRYTLGPDGATTVERFNKDGERIGEPVSLGRLEDPHGNAMLPLVPAILGDHPTIARVGTGLLHGLDDMVIDLYNIVSEMREAYRNAAFALLTHTGPDAEEVRKQLGNGSLFIALGDGERAGLARLAGDSTEVATGISLVELGVKMWALGAKRQAAEAMSDTAAQAGSGVQVEAEFSLDLKPLLVSLVTLLDRVETNALYIAAQLAGANVSQADKLGVRRDTHFRLEDEASRIARIVGEFVATLPLPPEAKVNIAMRWLEAAKVFDLTEPSEEVKGKTKGEVAEEELRDMLAAEQEGAIRMATGAGLPDPGTLPELDVGQGDTGGTGDAKGAPKDEPPPVKGKRKLKAGAAS
jgi:hypothetical protein